VIKNQRGHRLPLTGFLDVEAVLAGGGTIRGISDLGGGTGKGGENPKAENDRGQAECFGSHHSGFLSKWGGIQALGRSDDHQGREGCCRRNPQVDGAHQRGFKTARALSNQSQHALLSCSDFPSYALNFLAADNTDETFVDPYMQIHTVR
jgi:hypothetical protein